MCVRVCVRVNMHVCMCMCVRVLVMLQGNDIYMCFASDRGVCDTCRCAGAGAMVLSPVPVLVGAKRPRVIGEGRMASGQC